MKEIIKTFTIIALFAIVSIDNFSEGNIFMGCLMASASVLNILDLVFEIKKN